MVTASWVIPVGASLTTAEYFEESQAEIEGVSWEIVMYVALAKFTCSASSASNVGLGYLLKC